MDGDSTERAKRYRDHAKEIRAAAGDMNHSPSRAALLRLADTYESLASRIEAEFKRESD